MENFKENISLAMWVISFMTLCSCPDMIDTGTLTNKQGIITIIISLLLFIISSYFAGMLDDSIEYYIGKKFRSDYIKEK